ncbi:MAG: glucose-6-phosphate isomerase [Bacteroidetes bacterium]|nr:MAG: glucose-6-phosphate isomerase [Bacteroidota bacterium]
MANIQLGLGPLAKQIADQSLPQLAAQGREALASLRGGSCRGNDFIGWATLPSGTESTALDEIYAMAADIATSYDVAFVIGIGGSYRGGESLLSALQDQLSAPRVELRFLGLTLDPDYVNAQLQGLEGKRVATVVISKSGTTLEPALAFRLLSARLRELGLYEAKGGYVITDPEGGALRQMAQSEGFHALSIPPSVGGRYSVLTPVGLLPLALGGVDIRELMRGAQLAQNENYDQQDGGVALQYGLLRNLFYQHGKQLEIWASYSPWLVSFGEWYKQLFAESEGKEGRGVFPVAVSYSTDLHSLAQYFQQGLPLFFETHLLFGRAQHDIEVSHTPGNEDGLNYLAGRGLHGINRVAAAATIKAHETGGIPCMTLELPERNAFQMGYLVYFLELSCALSALILGVNPFDQPGVQTYKANMVEILKG